MTPFMRLRGIGSDFCREVGEIHPKCGSQCRDSRKRWWVRGIPSTRSGQRCLNNLGGFFYNTILLSILIFSDFKITFLPILLDIGGDPADFVGPSDTFPPLHRLSYNIIETRI